MAGKTSFRCSCRARRARAGAAPESWQRLAAGPDLCEAWPASTLDPRAAFVPGEALVKLRPRANAADATDVWASLGAHPVSARRNAVGYARVVLDPPGGTKGTRGAVRHHDAESTLLAIKGLRHSGQVLWAEPNYIRKAHALPPNDPLFPAQWHYAYVSLLDAWDHTDGTGAIVAVIDTGVKKSHPDFVNADATSQLLPGYDMISDPSIAADGDGRDSNADDPGDGDLLNESSWHGSHTSGTVAVDPSTGVAIAQGTTRASDGYDFTMPNMPPGDYLLYAGTDLDDNGVINDDGEAFGAYPLMSDAQAVHATSDVTGLEFPLRFQYNVQPTTNRVNRGK